METARTQPIRIQPLRSKRKDIQGPSSTQSSVILSDGKARWDIHGTKRVRARKDADTTEDFLEDKENFHRSRIMAPRSRPARVLHDLVVDLPTDCSDFEVNMDTEDDSSPTGSLFHELQRRMSNPNEKHYHFSVYEDPIERSN